MIRILWELRFKAWLNPQISSEGRQRGSWGFIFTPQKAGACDSQARCCFGNPWYCLERFQGSSIDIRCAFFVVTQFVSSKIIYLALPIIGLVCLAASGVLFFQDLFSGAAPQKSSSFPASTTRATKWLNTVFVNLTNWRQFFMRLPCYWSWISSWHCQSSCGSTRR